MFQKQLHLWVSSESAKLVSGADTFIKICEFLDGKAAVFIRRVNTLNAGQTCVKTDVVKPG
jgi:hypothetical protein